MHLPPFTGVLHRRGAGQHAHAMIACGVQCARARACARDKSYAHAILWLFGVAKGGGFVVNIQKDLEGDLR